MARGLVCAAHQHDTPAPQERHHIRPLSRGGSNHTDNLTVLCANAHGDVHYFLDLIERAAREALPDRPNLTAGQAAYLIPGTVAARYGPKVRRFARAGWLAYGDEFLQGVWDRHAVMWSTSGRPVTGDRAVSSSVPPFEVALTRVEVPYWLSMAGLYLAARDLPPGRPMVERSGAS